MANSEHVDRLKQGSEIWNAWRYSNPGLQPDLIEAELAGCDLTGALLSDAKLAGADLWKANLFAADLKRADLREVAAAEVHLSKADLRGADLRHADLAEAIISQAKLNSANLSYAILQGTSLNGSDLTDANLQEADLTGATLIRANLHRVNLKWAILNEASLREADLVQADLTGAELAYASLVEADIEQASIVDCMIYGISAWGLIGTPKDQSDLAITLDREITVDNLEVAQFVHLLLENENFRKVIDTITSKVVLILGRFTDERKQVLEALRDALRDRGYVPMLFDFQPSARRDLTETVQILANMAKFVIADITDAKSIPQELSHIIPFFPSVPVQPILLASKREFAMFEHWRGFRSVLPEFLYDDAQHLVDNLEVEVLQPVTTWQRETNEVAALKDKIRELNAELAQQRQG